MYCKNHYLYQAKSFLPHNGGGHYGARDLIRNQDDLETEYGSGDNDSNMGTESEDGEI